MRCESFPQSILGGNRKENANIEINTSQSIKHNHVNKTPQHRSQCKQAQSPLFNLPTIVDENDSGLMNITMTYPQPVPALFLKITGLCEACKYLNIIWFDNRI